VDTAFGCPGAAILPMYDAMHGSGVEHLIVGHEEGPTHMTDRWARTTGGIGVVIGISGPAGTMERPLILAGAAWWHGQCEDHGTYGCSGTRVVDPAEIRASLEWAAQGGWPDEPSGARGDHDRARGERVDGLGAESVVEFEPVP
jgi:hypothetical protein